MVKIAEAITLPAIGKAAAVILLSFCAGYYASPTLIPSAPSTPPETKPLDASEPIKTKMEDDNSESESESEEEDDSYLSSLALESGDSVKMVLVVRTDLGMTSGKIAAQCSHAALACYKSLKTHNPHLLRQWESTGQKKVALRCEGEEELLTLQAIAQSLNLCARSIQDAGRTQIEAGSRTVLGIAGPAALVDQVAGHLSSL